MRGQIHNSGAQPCHVLPTLLPHDSWEVSRVIDVRFKDPGQETGQNHHSGEEQGEQGGAPLIITGVTVTLSSIEVDN